MNRPPPPRTLMAATRPIRREQGNERHTAQGSPLGRPPAGRTLRSVVGRGREGAGVGVPSLAARSRRNLQFERLRWAVPLQRRPPASLRRQRVVAGGMPMQRRPAGRAIERALREGTVREHRPRQRRSPGQRRSRLAEPAARDLRLGSRERRGRRHGWDRHARRRRGIAVRPAPRARATPGVVASSVRAASTGDIGERRGPPVRQTKRARPRRAPLSFRRVLDVRRGWTEASRPALYTPLRSWNNASPEGPPGPPRACPVGSAQRLDHPDPATTAHLIRRTIGETEREPRQQASERNEMTNEPTPRRNRAIR